jgi:hypothetical protein
MCRVCEEEYVKEQMLKHRNRSMLKCPECQSTIHKRSLSAKSKKFIEKIEDEEKKKAKKLKETRKEQEEEEEPDVEISREKAMAELDQALKDGDTDKVLGWLYRAKEGLIQLNAPEEEINEITVRTQKALAKMRGIKAPERTEIGAQARGEVSELFASIVRKTYAFFVNYIFFTIFWFVSLLVGTGLTLSLISLILPFAIMASKGIYLYMGLLTKVASNYFNENL